MRNASTASRQRGGVMILVAISGAVLIGFIGIVVDLGRLYVTKTELQSAMDACALAAAAELRPGVTPTDPQAIARAVSAGITAGNRNMVGFQAVSANVASADILFSDRLSDNSTTWPFGYVSNTAADPATASYAMCGRAQSGITTWFMQVLDGFLGVPPTTQTVGAWATATPMHAQNTCAGIPLGICQQTSPCPSGGTPDAYGFCVGDWYGGKFAAGSGSTGSFNWIDFTPPAGGASELSGGLSGSGSCDATIGDVVGQAGIIQSAEKAWNTRFGLYTGGYKNSPKPTPDFTGYAYTSATSGGKTATWPSRFNAFSGTDGSTPNFQAARAGYMPYPDSDPVKVLTGNSYDNSSSTTLKDDGASRRLVTVPVVNCTSWAGAQTIPVLDWACVLMLRPMDSPSDDEKIFEYRGLANAAGSPCSSAGLPGGTSGPLVPALVH